ncbi:MAG: type IX secretion system outer membrane channel protein PorV [Prolixibacteraceae bacterium]|nr:type IX secretion system outer membrane channel protein PorV [Prolixibacteraceae bacterium]
MTRISIISILFFLFFTGTASAQSTTGAGVVSSAVPFLTIAPDSRGGAMGDVGAATLPDINAQTWNPAKYAFIESNTGIALSYTPWLRNLIGDMNLAYLVGYHKLDKLQTLSGSLRYFDLGSMQLYDNTGNPTNSTNPNEFAVDMAYALKLSDNWSGSVALRYILSDIFSGIGSTAGQTTTDLKAGHAFASDVSFFYNKTFLKSRKESNIAWGVNISNIGSKISYDGGQIKDFIPTNLRLGGAYTTDIDKYNKVSFALDFNKLLVPSPEYEIIDGQVVFSDLGNADIGPIDGIFKSFYDAPNGFQEELSEITVSLGAEYWYSKQFAVRTGYFHEAKDKGDRKFLTFGAGLKMNVFSIDFSYIYTLSRTSPLENTLRFTLGFDLENFQKQGRTTRR